MKRFKFCSFLCALFLLMFATSLTTWAAPKNKWVEKDGYYSYYDTKGKVVTGLKTIDGRKYYFNKNGRQLHGWRKIGKDYYFFARYPGSMGCMVKDCKVERIVLGRDGKAVLNTSLAKKLAPVLADYAKWADETVKFTWSDSKKLTAMAKMMRGQYEYHPGVKWKKDPEWHVSLAKEAYLIYSVLKNCNTYECQRWGCAFGYLAVACGFDDVVLHIGGRDHAWVSIGKRMFNPTGMMGGKLSEFNAATQKKVADYKDIKAYPLNRMGF